MSMPDPNKQLPNGRGEECRDSARHDILPWDAGHSRVPLLGEYTTGATDRKRRRPAMRVFHSFAALVLLLVFLHYWRLPNWAQWYDRIGREYAQAETQVNSGAFDWSAHIPSKVLNWSDCYVDIGDFQCARLSVPLLYSEPSGEEAAVALIRYPPRYPIGHEKYRGPILFNPGGPGGSGISLLLGRAKLFQTILSDEFDLIGFDPRGVGSTTPALVTFFDRVEAGKFFLGFPENLNISESSLGEAYARANILGDIAADRVRFVAERVSTPLVAQDMLSIVKAFGHDKLQYGTVLGATFAAMFPDNVGRLIIDGVEDTEDYYKGLWSNNLRDTDATLMDIYQACVKAGPSLCPIYEKNAALVEARVDRLLERLKSEPVAFYNSTSPGGAYDVVDYALVRSVIFRTLYTTHNSGAYLAKALAALEREDPSLFYTVSGRRTFDKVLQCNCPVPGEPNLPARDGFEITTDVTAAIGCGDIVGTGTRGEDFEIVREAYEEMALMSSFASNWAIRTLCSGWKVTAKERFNGSFEQSTSYPLLIIGNTAGKPLWNAHKMSSGFKDSVVLTQNSSGHCSIAATSLCTFKAVRAFFVNGTLPEKGTVCEVDSSIFGEKEGNLSALSIDERNLVNAAEELRRNYFIPPLGGGRVPSAPF